MPKSKPNKHKKSKKKQSNYRRPPKEKLQKKDIVGLLCLSIAAVIKIMFESVWLKKYFEFTFNDYVVAYTPFKTWDGLCFVAVALIVFMNLSKDPIKNKKIYTKLLIFFILLITVIHFAVSDIWVFNNEKIQRYNYAGTCKATYNYSNIVKVNYDWGSFFTFARYVSNVTEVYEIVFDDETKVDVYEVESIEKDDDSFEVFRNRMEMYISE